MECDNDARLLCKQDGVANSLFCQHPSRYSQQLGFVCPHLFGLMPQQCVDSCSKMRYRPIPPTVRQFKYSKPVNTDKPGVYHDYP